MMAFVEGIIEWLEETKRPLTDSEKLAIENLCYLQMDQYGDGVEVPEDMVLDELADYLAEPGVTTGSTLETAVSTVNTLVSDGIMVRSQFDHISFLNVILD